MRFPSVSFHFQPGHQRENYRGAAAPSENQTSNPPSFLPTRENFLFRPDGRQLIARHDRGDG